MDELSYRYRADTTRDSHSIVVALKPSRSAFEPFQTTGPTGMRTAPSS
jgi:hypothetical protein